jgi:hypothetical protein
MVWGLDMVGQLKRALGGFMHLLVAIDKFSKWIEGRPICNVRSEEAVEFLADIIYSFGIPNAIITDRSNFTGKKFLRFYDDNNIQIDWAVVNHPRTDGQVESANGMVLQGLKLRMFKRLKKFKAKWVVELPSVLWSLRSTSTHGTSHTPFFMVHGLEAVLPIDIDYGSLIVRAYTDEGNQASLEDAILQTTEPTSNDATTVVATPLPTQHVFPCPSSTGKLR